MNDSSEDKKQESIGIKNELKLNESLRSIQEEIKENRKFINFTLRTLTQKKNLPTDALKRECVAILRNFDRGDLTRLVDEEQNTLVHILCREEKVEYLKAIVDAYFTIVGDKEKFYEWFTFENSQNLTPFDIAVQRSNREIINFLYDVIKKTDETKLKLTEKRNNLFHYASKRNECYPIIFFYEKFHNIFAAKNINIINLSNQFGITPLHYACYFGSKKAIDILLDLGADINGVDQDGNTCLHYAINSSDLRTVKKLLIRGANKNIRRNDGKSPYELALELNKIEIANILYPKSLLQKFVCMENEITMFKPSRNDLFLLITLLIIITLKLSYILIIENILYTDPPNLKSGQISIKDSKYEKFVDCMFDDLCTFETIITFLSLFANILLISIVAYFTCCRGRTLSMKKKNKNTSLIELYENNSNVCVKCMDYMEFNTIHCIVCDICVNEWDHHCFWLNTCINDTNKRAFKIFFFNTVISIVLETIFIFFNFFFSFGMFKDNFYISFFKLPDNSASVLLCMKTIWRLFFGIFFATIIYIIIFVTYPILKNLCFRTDKRSLSGVNNDFETRLIAKSLNDKQSLNSFSI